MSAARLAGLLLAAGLIVTGCAVTPPTTISLPTATPSQAASSASASPRASVSPSATPSSSTPPKDTRSGGQLDHPYSVNGVIVVSKKHRISARYAPAQPTGPYRLDAQTATALKKMTAAAKKAGVTIVVKSGYRSYTTQKASYDRALKTQPQNINFYAPPGASEHQTGLAVDLWDGKVWYRPMAYTKTGKWLHAHAHEYGFILRFPQGKEKITGVPYEPWHFRYVGTEHSLKFDKGNRLTLEEYLGLN